MERAKLKSELDDLQRLVDRIPPDILAELNGSSGIMERKGDFISTNIRYKKETEVVTFQGREITLENLSPVFTPEQEAAKRRELEQQLYEVFRKIRR